MMICAPNAIFASPWSAFAPLRAEPGEAADDLRLMTEKAAIGALGLELSWRIALGAAALGMDLAARVFSARDVEEVLDLHTQYWQDASRLWDEALAETKRTARAA